MFVPETLDTVRLNQRYKLGFLLFIRQLYVLTVILGCVVWMTVDINSVLLLTILTCMYLKETVMMIWRWRKCKLIL